MGWDLTFLRIKPGVRCPIEMSDGLLDDPVPDADIESLAESFPDVARDGSGTLIWDGGDRGIMVLIPGDGSLFVGHAKLEPALALYQHFEAACPGWLILDLSDAKLYDPAALSAEHDRRRALADELRRRQPV